ncbi:hypothetical protein CPB97_003508 [Podila verticillata]|nr:hypothetical protein CPB97_003508 [Podila verticillata]
MSETLKRLLLCDLFIFTGFLEIVSKDTDSAVDCPNNPRFYPSYWQFNESYCGSRPKTEFMGMIPRSVLQIYENAKQLESKG